MFGNSNTLEARSLTITTSAPARITNRASDATSYTPSSPILHSPSSGQFETFGSNTTSTQDGPAAAHNQPVPNIQPAAHCQPPTVIQLAPINQTVPITTAAINAQPATAAAFQFFERLPKEMRIAVIEQLPVVEGTRFQHRGQTNG